MVVDGGLASSFRRAGAVSCDPLSISYAKWRVPPSGGSPPTKSFMAVRDRVICYKAGAQRHFDRGHS